MNKFFHILLLCLARAIERPLTALMALIFAAQILKQRKKRALHVDLLDEAEQKLIERRLAESLARTAGPQSGQDNYPATEKERDRHRV